METKDYRMVPLLLPSGREDAEHRRVDQMHVPGSGMMTLDGGLTWFHAGDPFNNRLALMMGRCGDDWIGTVLYAGLPCMLVQAGGTMGDGEYERVDVTYLEPAQQEIHAHFFENVIGDMPTEGEEDTVRAEGWPFPHAASVMVHERQTEEYMLDRGAKQVPANPEHYPHYDLYHDLMPESGSQGYEITMFTGFVADSMFRAEPEDLTEPKGF